MQYIIVGAGLFVKISYLADWRRGISPLFNDCNQPPPWGTMVKYFGGGAKPGFPRRSRCAFGLTGVSCGLLIARQRDSARPAVGVGQGGCSTWEVSH